MPIVSSVEMMVLWANEEHSHMLAPNANTLLASAPILTIISFSNTIAEAKGCLQNETLTDCSTGCPLKSSQPPCKVMSSCSVETRTGWAAI